MCDGLYSHAFVQEYMQSKRQKGVGGCPEWDHQISKSGSEEPWTNREASATEKQVPGPLPSGVVQGDTGEGQNCPMGSAQSNGWSQAKRTAPQWQGSQVLREPYPSGLSVVLSGSKGGRWIIVPLLVAPTAVTELALHRKIMCVQGRVLIWKSCWHTTLFTHSPKGLNAPQPLYRQWGSLAQACSVPPL